MKTIKCLSCYSCSSVLVDYLVQAAESINDVVEVVEVDDPDYLDGAIIKVINRSSDQEIIFQIDGESCDLVIEC